jgi:CAAX protease family protein
LARIQGERSAWLAKSYRSRRSLNRRGAGKETGVAEASLGSTLYAGSVPDVPAGLPRQRGLGWDFIDLAGLGDNRLRCYLIGLLRILLYPLGFAIIAGVAIGVAIAIPAALAHRPFPGIGPIPMLILQFGSIAMVGVAVLRTVARTHKRTWLSVVAPDLRLDWRRLAIGLGFELALKLLLLLFAAAAGQVRGATFAAMTADQLALLGVALFLVPLQAASEEILFRGYLTQALGRILPSRCLIVVAIALLFGLLHLNTYGPVTLPYFLVLSLLYSLVSLRDGRLELAIGGHAAMNLFAVWLGNAMSGEPATPHAAVTLTWAMVAILLAHGALFYALTRLLVRRFCHTRPAA